MKILFITSSRIGDAILTTGVLSHLTQTLPNAQIALAAGPVAAPLFEDWPRLMWTHVLHRHGPLGHWFDLWKKARHMAWDWIIDLRGSAISFMLKSKRRSVWRKPSRIQPRVEAIANVIGVTPTPAPYLYVSPERFKDLIVPAPFLVVAPAANWHGKEWPLENYRNLLTRLFTGPLKDWQLLILGSPEERTRLAPLIKTFSHRHIHVHKTPSKDIHHGLPFQGSLLDCASLMKRASLFIGNDSGLMHMSAALGIPTIGLFGPSPETLYDPYGPHGYVIRTPCSYKELMDRKKRDPYACLMDGLSVDAVYKAVCAYGEKEGIFPCVV